jgi:hypothetical protein
MPKCKICKQDYYLASYDCCDPEEPCMCGEMENRGINRYNIVKFIKVRLAFFLYNIANKLMDIDYEY